MGIEIVAEWNCGRVDGPYARLIFGQKKTLDIENTYKMYGIFAKFSNSIYI